MNFYTKILRAKAAATVSVASDTWQPKGVTRADLVTFYLDSDAASTDDTLDAIIQGSYDGTTWFTIPPDTAWVQVTTGGGASLQARSPKFLTPYMRIYLTLAGAAAVSIPVGVRVSAGMVKGYAS